MKRDAPSSRGGGAAKKRKPTAAEKLRVEDWRARCEELTCSICHDFYVAPVTLRCSHVFCAACVWTQARPASDAADRVCSLCKAPIVEDDADEPSSRWKGEVYANAAQEYVLGLGVVSNLRELAAAERALEATLVDGHAEEAAAERLLPASAANELLRTVPFDEGDGYSRELLVLIDEEGADKCDSEERSLLWWACETGKLGVVTALLGDFDHVNINRVDEKTRTAPLARAIMGGHAEVVAALLAVDTDETPLDLEWDTVSGDGESTALELAVQYERHSIAMMLVKHAPPDVDEVPEETLTFLGSALVRSLMPKT